jgi:hypothetical protein
MKMEDKSVVSDLAEAISSLDISKIAGLLSEDGSFSVQDENYNIVRSDNSKFLAWLHSSYNRFISSGKSRRKLHYVIVKSMHNPAALPIILFEDGRFPVLSVNQLKEEKSGLLIKWEDHKITGIDFCFLVMKTESPFIYEKRYLNPEL